MFLVFSMWVFLAFVIMQYNTGEAWTFKLHSFSKKLYLSLVLDWTCIWMRAGKYSVMWPTGGNRSAIDRGFSPRISVNFAALHLQWWRLLISEIFSNGTFLYQCCFTSHSRILCSYCDVMGGTLNKNHNCACG